MVLEEMVVGSNLWESIEQMQHRATKRKTHVFVTASTPQHTRSGKRWLVMGDKSGSLLALVARYFAGDTGYEWGLRHGSIPAIC